MVRAAAGMTSALHSTLSPSAATRQASLQSATHPPQACAPQSLRYAKAAAIVRASAVRVTPDIRGGDLPFIGDVTGVDGALAFGLSAEACAGLLSGSLPPTTAHPCLCIRCNAALPCLPQLQRSRSATSFGPGHVPPWTASAERLGLAGFAAGQLGPTALANCSAVFETGEGV